MFAMVERSASRSSRAMGPQLFLEFRQRVSSAFGVWIVGGEHEQVRSSLFDHPTHRFTREGSELEVTVRVFARASPRRQQQRFLGAAEGPLGVVRVMHPRHHPSRTLLDQAPSQVREAIEQPIQNQGAQEQRRRMEDGQVVFGPDVVAPTQVVGDWHVAVLWKARSRSRPLPAHQRAARRGRRAPPAEPRTRRGRGGSVPASRQR